MNLRRIISNLYFLTITTIEIIKELNKVKNKIKNEINGMNDEMIKIIKIITIENDLNHNKNIKKRFIIMMKKMIRTIRTTFIMLMIMMTTIIMKIEIMKKF